MGLKPRLPLGLIGVPSLETLPGPYVVLLCAEVPVEIPLLVQLLHRH